MTLVSVLTPSFNQGIFIEECLESVAQQTYSPVEHIVMDGGSTDETVTILRRWSGKVIWCSEKDEGQSDALNKAFHLSKGDIIGWLNSDDAYFNRDAVLTAVKAFEEDPDLDVVYGNCALLDDANNLLHIIFVPPRADSLLKLGNFFWQPSVFVRRQSLGSCLVDSSLHFGMDRELWLRLKYEKRKFKKISKIVAIDREYASRKSVSGRELAQAEWSRIDRRFGCHDGILTSTVRKLLKISFRWTGIICLPSVFVDNSIPVKRSKFLKLVMQQMLLSRSMLRASVRGESA